MLACIKKGLDIEAFAQCQIPVQIPISTDLNTQKWPGIAQIRSSDLLATYLCTPASDLKTAPPVHTLPVLGCCSLDRGRAPTAVLWRKLQTAYCILQATSASRFTKTYPASLKSRPPLASGN